MAPAKPLPPERPAIRRARPGPSTSSSTSYPAERWASGPSAIRATLGEQIRFVVRNDGQARHEFRIDSIAGNATHKAMMARMPGMVHHDANAITLAPGATGTLVWRFSKPGIYEFACLLPGHYEAGMHGTVVVSTSTMPADASRRLH